MGALAGWENFYVIVGSSAGALVGLQFVVITLIADRPTVHTDSERASGAFATPTVIHFVSVLLLAALMSAPWQQIDGPAAMCGVVGIAGFFYSFVVARRMRSQTAYKPVLEDWMFHFVLPIAAYATLIVSFFGIRASASPGPLRGRRRIAASAVRGNSQCLGRSHVLRLRTPGKAQVGFAGM